ncbi:hypothetical protein [Flavobacterium ardleyense]|uniref:hypothetical protein n=1 Tax=Flavobacterium ardleyense TaxID=2038737 RepID=UPI00298CF19B|nr:hypothetical protein [Flavobacterium ardleyense]
MTTEITDNITFATTDKENMEQSVSSILAFAERGITTHLILNLLSVDDINIKNLKNLKPLAKMYKKANKSLVIVCQDIDFTEVPEFINVVPTIIEANDIIAMEDIERDLGF